MPASLRTLKSADFVVMPWQNGGGVTRQIAIWPPGAGLDNFTYRISSASVEASGPFSRFPGVDRSLTVLGGGELHLQGAAVSRALSDRDAPISFSGEEEVMCRIAPGQRVDDFNVMTRRALCTHSLQRFRLSQPTARWLGTTLIYVLSGSVQATLADTQMATAGEAMLLQTRSPCLLSIATADAEAEVLFVTINMLGDDLSGAHR